MALAVTTVFEVRSSATANNLNGGGFNASNASPGTDRSQSDTAYKDHNDLVIGTAGNENKVTSAAHAFTSDDNGNIIHITAGTGFTVGWYEVVSVDGSNVATLDRACGTAESTGGTYYLGGAMSLSSSLDDDFFEAIAGCQKVWIKNGNYTGAETINLTADSSSTTRLVIEGYNSTRGDKPTGATRPVFNMGSYTITLGDYCDIYNVIVNGTGASTLTLGAGSRGGNLKIINTSTTANRIGISFGTLGTIYACEVVSYLGYGTNSSNTCAIHGCYAHDSAVGYRYTGTLNMNITNSISACNTVSAVALTGAATQVSMISGNTFYGSATKVGEGISLADGATGIRLFNNIIAGFVTGVNHGTAGSKATLSDYNDYYNNTTDVTNLVLGDNDVDVDPAFTSVSEVTGSTATYATKTLTDAGADFSSVVDNQDFVHIISGTGMTAGKYLITSHTGTTITTDNDAGECAEGDTVYSVSLGHNYLPTGDI
jgi:hypothetical protein